MIQQKKLFVACENCFFSPLNSAKYSVQFCLYIAVVRCNIFGTSYDVISDLTLFYMHKNGSIFINIHALY